MKQSLKYGLLIIFTLLLHALAMQATEEFSVSNISSYQKCSVSQARPIQNAIERIYYFYSALSCDIEHADITHISTDKSFSKLTVRQLNYRGIIPSRNNNSIQLYTHDPQDPIVHYIYGQRKIVI